MQNDVVKFLRRRDYRLIRELGQGACGKTVLLQDDEIDESLVCKKFAPQSEADRRPLFDGFVREVKILHRLNHPNVVRVFNYYLYPDDLTGYILMEFIGGCEIDDYLAGSPEMINEVFLQAVAGFSHLEANGILHRDIRPGNLLVRDDGILKIIDFGFGKQVVDVDDFDKSVSLNWWCQPPDEFATHVYDFRTEVYFVGKLFEQIIQANGLDQFKYGPMLARMCVRNPDDRVESFSEVDQHLQTDMFFEIGFDPDERWTYQQFSDALAKYLTKIETGAKYEEDPERLQTALENAYRAFMIEETVPDSCNVIRCIVRGAYYRRPSGLPVSVVGDFLRLLKSCSPERKRIILANLHTRLDAIPRYQEPEPDDDIPF